MNIHPPGTIIANRYEVAGNPLMGGMGIVYLCMDLVEKRPVALKTFQPQFLPNRAARDRFLSEGTTWVNLGRHPHIVRCYAVEYIDPNAFLVLELIAKEQDREDASLRAWLGAPMPVEQVLLFVLQIARGMQHASDTIFRFVHRDLKPENVLVGADKLPGTEINRLRVTDFGLAVILRNGSGELAGEDNAGAVGRTHLTRGILGTPLYMAPEQWKDEPLGVYSDVYALGCILLEMLTGKRAATGQSINDLRATHCAGELRPLPNELPEAIKEFLQGCLALHPDDRWGDWTAVTGALEAICATQGLSSVPIAGDAGYESARDRRGVSWSYNALGNSYADMGKVQVATDYFRKSLEIAREIGDQRGEGVALGNLGLAFRSLGDVRRAIGYFEQSLISSHETGNWRSRANALDNMGLAYADIGDAQRAIGYHEQALEISRENSNRHGQVNALGNLGELYRNLGDVQRSIEYHEQALEISCEIQDRRGEGNALGNLGNAYLALSDAQRAIGYYEQQLVITLEIGDRRGEGTALGNLGVAYENLGDAQRALGYFEQALAIDREIRHLDGVARHSFNMATLFSQQGNISRALRLAQDAAQIWTQIGSPNTQYAQTLVEQLGCSASAPVQTDPVQTAFEAFQCAASLQGMQAVVNQHPFMTDAGFIQAVEETITKQVPPEHKLVFQQRLGG